MGKGLNPADQFRKEQKKKEIKKSKKEQEEKHRIQSLLNDPRKIDEEITKLEKLSQENKLDKSIKDKIKEFQTMKVVALKKEKVRLDTARLRGEIIPEEKETEKSSASNKPQHAPSSSSSSLAFPPSMPKSAVAYYPGYTGMVPPPPPPPGFQPYGQMMPPHMQGYPTGFPMTPLSTPLPMMSVGGMNGIPPPPPRPMMAVGGQHGVPLPPPRHMMMGGQNGIPPPPPRAPVPHGAYGAQPMMPPRPPDRHMGRARQQQVIDPLDPTHSKYAERFQTDFMKPQPEQHQAPTPQMNLQPSMQQYTSAAVEAMHGNVDTGVGPGEDDNNNDEDEDEDVEDEDEDDSYEPTEEELEEQRLIEMRLQSHLNPSISIQPPTAAVEPPPISIVPAIATTSNSSSNNSSGGSAPGFSKNLSDFSVSTSMMELIMKRRHMTAADSGPAPAPVADSNPAAPTTAVAAPKAKKVKQKEAETNALASLIGSYGNDSDDDEEDEEEEDDEVRNQSGEAVEGLSKNVEYEDIEGPSVGPTRPPTEYADYMYPEPPPLADSSYAYPYPDPSSFLPPPDPENAYERPELPIAPLDVATSNSMESASADAAAPAPKQGKLLKVVRPDSGLTAFLPAALRAKRPVAATEKVCKDDDSSFPPEKVAKLSSSTEPRAPSNAPADDSYDAFMNEISQL